MKTLKKMGTIVISVLLWLVILVAALYAFTTIATRDNQNVSSLLGYTPLVVKSDSMAPTFSAGDLIFIKKCDTSTLKEGDIICFHTIIDNEYALNTHRIQKIDTVGDARSYTTLGDNNNGIADAHIISDGDIVGKWMDVVTIYIIPFAALLGAITIYYILGWNALKQELDKGRKKPVGPTFKFLGKYVYVFLAIIILILGILYNGIG